MRVSQTSAQGHQDGLKAGSLLAHRSSARLLLQRVHGGALLANLHLHGIAQARALQLRHLQTARRSSQCSEGAFNAMSNSKMSDTRRPAAPVMQHRARAFDVMVALYSCVRRSVGITCRQHSTRLARQLRIATKQALERHDRSATLHASAAACGGARRTFRILSMSSSKSRLRMRSASSSTRCCSCRRLNPCTCRQRQCSRTASAAEQLQRC
jgi:hypothetical protein